MKRRSFNVAAALVAAGIGPATRARDWPTRPIRVVVPSAPGGLSDGFVRMVGDGLLAAWGHNVVMEHRAGAGGLIGTEHVAKSAGDGYTLLMGNNGPLAVNPSLYPKVPYDVRRDFVPVSLVAVYPNVVVVNPSLPARNLAELIELARRNPGTINFASAGTGQSHHLNGEVFKRMAGVDIRHVPYKGSGPALSDLVGGHVQMMFSNVPPAIPLIRAGRLRALAITSAARSPVLPDVPPVADTLPGFDNFSWLCLVAPRATPAEIVADLNREIARVAGTPEALQRYYREQGATPRTDLDPTRIQAFLDDELAKWAKVIRDGNIRAE